MSNLTWAENSLPSSGSALQIRDCVWAPAIGGGLFVAVGFRSGSTSNVLTSPDGVTWTTRTGAEANSWTGIAYSPTAGAGVTPLLVAVARTGTNRVMTSADGSTWTARSASAAKTWVSVAWDAGLALFVACANDTSTTTGVFMSSPDGITWTAHDAVTGATGGKSWQGVAASGASRFVVVSSSATGAPHNVNYSTDGLSYTDPSVATRIFGGQAVVGNKALGSQAVVWSSALGLYAAINSLSGVNIVYTSTDGTSWTATTMPAGSTDGTLWSTIQADAAGFIILSDNTQETSKVKCVARSSNGTTWTTSDPGVYRNWHSLCYSSTLDIYVSFPETASDTVLTGTVRTQSHSPSSGHDGGGYTLTITGDGVNGVFTSGHTFVVAVYPTAAYAASAPDYSTNYSLGTIAADYGLFATNVTRVSDYSLTCTMPHGCGAAAQYGLAPGAVINSVAVFDTSISSPTANLKFYKASGFTYLDPLIVSVNVHTGPSVGGTAITVTGTNFYQDEGLFSLGQNRVEFNGNIAFATYVSATQLTIVSPPYNGDGDYVQTLTFVPSLLSNGANGQSSTRFEPASSSIANDFTYTADWWRFHVPDGLDFSFPPFSYYSYGPPDVTGPSFDWLPPTFNVPRSDWPRIAGPPNLWWTLDTAPDHNGWWGSTASMGGSSFLLNSTDRPVAPRPWTKISTFATSDTAMLGGSPGAGCVINNRLIYPASSYSGSYPTIRLYNGRSDYQLGTVPGTAAGAAPYTIMSMLAANGTIYYSTIDTGSNSTNWVGRVFSFDILSGVSTPIGAALTTGHVPYALAWHNGRLWCGTHRQSTAAVGHVFWIRPGIDTDWTDDHTLASGSVSSMLSFQGKLYVGTTDAALAFARLLKRDTAGAWSTADTGVGGTAKASNGWLALADFGDTLYASYWNDDATPISKIRKSVDGTTWTTAYTGATTTLRPFIGMTTDKTYLIAIAGGLGRTSAILRTSDGTTWVDETAYLESTTETALPIFGTVIH